MLSLKAYLTAAGLDVPHNKIKLVRHVDGKDKSYNLDALIKANAFDFFQAEQGYIKKGSKKGPFHDCDVIISFISTTGRFAKLKGIYRVNDVRSFNDEDYQNAPEVLKNCISNSVFWYDLEELNQFSSLTNRLIVEFNRDIGWLQKLDLPIFELRPVEPEIKFPGFQDLILTWNELKTICKNPLVHKAYTTALKSTAGIYRIIDNLDGAAYIGSASGLEGLWQRWSQYAQTGHGNNRELKKRNPENFQWSIIRTLSGSMSRSEVNKIEKIEKDKHGSKVHGLNPN